MKKLSLVLMLFLFVAGTAVAQKMVSGTVNDQDGEPLIGASVLVKGTSQGTVTDFDGKFELEVPANATTLIISYTGFTSQEVEIGNQTSFDISLAEGVLLTEAVVTGLGIEREKKSLGYAVQEVQGDAVNSVGDQNVVSALTGKVAGVQVISSSGAQLGGSANIRIRGANSLTGGQPLFVVDGTPISNANFSDTNRGRDWGNFASDINPEDIETISVLKGPAATAIYGNRGAGGVVLITTKKGKNRKGIGVTYTGSVTADRVYVLPEYQDEYGGGYTQDFLRATDPVDGQEYNVLNYAADESWGPRMDGTQYRPWWSWFPGEDYGTQIPLSPNPDNIRDFFETGVTFNNSLALTGGNETTTFRLSFTNIQQDGVLPNSELDRTNIGINASTQLTDKLTLGTSVNFVDIAGLGRPSFGYVGQFNVVNSFNQWFQRQLDMDRLRDYKNPDGTFRSWNIRSPTNLRPLYWDSPYFTQFENAATDSRNRYFGNISLTYQVNENLSLAGFLRRDDYTFRNETRAASGGLDLDDYNEFVANSREDNYEFLANYNKNFGDISVDANFGANIRRNDYRSNSLGVEGGLNAPNLYNLKASTDRPTATNFVSEKVVRSLYGGANFGYKSFLYLGFTLRNDWSSALPVENNSYLYPSVTGSFVFSELMNSSFLSFGKIRGSFAQVGSDIGPYQTQFTYSAGTPYGSVPAFTLPNTLINEDLRPALSSSYEVGLELRFFNDRLGFDFTYYNNDAEDQILTLTVPGSSGFGAAIINAGNINSNGFELAMNVSPVRSSKFNWDIYLNAATNTSTVEELADGLDNRQLSSWGWGGLAVNAPVGGEWGQFTGRGYTYFNGDESKPIINEDGSPVRTNNKNLGGLLPDWTGGFRNVIDFNNFSLSAFIEFQIGGQFHSVTRMFNAYSGLGAETVGNNDKGNPIRDPVSQGGGVRVDGVLADGTPHTVYVDPQTRYSDHLFAMNEEWMYDASYVKFRELSFGYNFPSKILGNTPIRSLKLSLIARNLWLIHTNVDGLDPSEIPPGSSNYVFQENGALPGVRSLGLNLRVGF
jgi:TonB-linked SusC/RagA family outer membrane protein